MSEIIWTAEDGWLDEGIPARTMLDARGRLHSFPTDRPSELVDPFTGEATGPFTPAEMVDIVGTMRGPKMHIRVAS